MPRFGTSTALENACVQVRSAFKQNTHRVTVDLVIKSMGSDFALSDKDGKGCRGSQGDLVDMNFSSLLLVPASGDSFLL